MDQHKDKLKHNPRASAGILSKLSFWWLLPLLSKGRKKDLVVEDLYEVEKCDESHKLASQIERCWEEERAKAKLRNRKASYARALWSCLGLRYIGVGMLAAIEECILRVCQPLLLGFMIRHVSGVPGYEEVWQGWMYASAFVGTFILYQFAHHTFFWGVTHIGMQIRVASCALLYRKALRLSKSALGKTTIGQMVNLLSNDVNRFDTSVIFINYLWIGPLQLLIVSVLLWDLLGPACMAGISLLILFIPLQSWMGKIFSRLRSATALRTDERVRVMNEIVNAMRVIKMYAWEKPFGELVRIARKKEIDVIMRTNYYRAVNMSLFFTSAKMVVFLALLTFVLTGNTLTAETVFVTTALINSVRLVMTLFFPFGIAMGSETLISCKRLQEFFEMEEVQESSRVQQKEQLAPSEKASVEIKDVTATWDAEAGPTLKHISTNVKSGQLLAIIGPVGAGKSSLLQAVLGEMPIEDGSISVRGRVAYAPQEAWLFSGTVKQNIVFGQKFSEKKYGEVIRVCGLESDLAQLPRGDETLVGERGTALSGGQKARITLARAAYMEGDVVLLDDPLSAVDSVVGRHLFRRCIRAHLKDKAVILVTHQLQYLNAADNIIVLNEGRCEAMGSYHQLINSGLNFAALLKDDKESRTLSVSSGRIAAIKRLESVCSSRRGSLQSRSGSFRLGDTNALLAASALSLTDSIASQDLPQSPDDEFIGDTTYDSPCQLKSSASFKKKKSLIPSTTAPLAAPPNSSSAEVRSTGTVSTSVYLKYFLNGGHWLLCLFLLLLNIVTQLLFSASDWWLSYWTNGEQLRGTYGAAPNDTINGTFTAGIGELPPGYLETETNVIIYSSLVGSLFFISLGRTVLFFMMCMASSRSLHNKMFLAVIRVPIKYFDTHPIGQVLNRFSKDMGQIDELLPSTLFDYITIMLQLVAIIAMISYLNFWLLLPTLLLFLVFVYVRRVYLASARDIKRLEGITRSPVFSHLSASLQGLTTIRAFRAQESFIKDFDSHQNTHSSAWFLFLCTTRWFGICLDWLSCLYIAIVTYTFMGMEDVMGGDIGLAISLAMTLSGMFQWGVRQSAEVENQMTSVERVLEFSKLEPEAPLEKPTDKALKQSWPESGSIEFKDVYLKYDENSQPVLKKLCFTINSGEKIGIVGRTGAGKSSLISCLFRLTEPQGSIMIDGVDIGSLGLHKLRNHISIIPQDPTLFNASFRKNLDPFSEHTDDQLWHALEEVQLKEVVQECSEGLEHMVSEGGSNLSVGQRQLLCLARAILSHNPILLMDEATANVDPKTDILIQQTVRQKFVGCTVLTVAHRLHTIMDSDRVMVMRAGKLEEMDAPHILLEDKNSLFAELVSQSDPSTATHLRKLARQAYMKTHPKKPDEIILTTSPSEASPATETTSPATEITSSPASPTEPYDGEGTNYVAGLNGGCDVKGVDGVREEGHQQDSDHKQSDDSVVGYNKDVNGDGVSDVCDHRSVESDRVDDRDSLVDTDVMFSDGQSKEYLEEHTKL